jgi:TonB family protein
MQYPIDARQKGIQGKSFIQFTVSKDGYIIPGSVKTLKSLHPSCDREAIRVLKLCNTQWQPAMKDGKRVNQRFVLPVIFNLTEEDIHTALNPIDDPIKTIVAENANNSGPKDSWTLYSDDRMQSTIGQVSAGDSVVVTGWAPWAFFIKTKSSNGYVSWKALKPTTALERLSSTIEVQSAIQDAKNDRLDKFGRDLKANAHLSMSSSKTTIFAGECVTLTLEFNVHDQNQVPLQFIDLGQQLAQMIPTITPDQCWIAASTVSDVIGESKTIENENFTAYRIYQASYCPSVAGILTIPAVTLKIAQLKLSNREIDTLISFVAKPVSVKVNALPSGVAPSAFDGYRLIGKFNLTDSIFAQEVHAGELVPYSITLRGEGMTFPVTPPEIKISGVKARVQAMADADTIKKDQLYSTKTFFYRILFEKPGVYNLGGKISFAYFNPTTGKVETITSKTTVEVLDGIKTGPARFPEIFGAKNNFIAIDASQSMQIEDYFPNRLGAVKRGLTEYIMNRDKCDLGLILFGGDAKHFVHTNPEKCYTRAFIDSIDFSFNTRGTAIGDAIWLAKNSYSENNLPKKLVIIGDGDNTAGWLPPKFAATLAKKHNIVIYTIGIGNTGLVPFGRDSSGRANMIDDTFTDKDFKSISSVTNGKYYWAKDEHELTRILKLIFQ